MKKKYGFANIIRLLLPMIILMMMSNLAVSVGLLILQYTKGVEFATAELYLEFQTENIGFISMFQGIGMIGACAFLWKDLKREVVSMIGEPKDKKNWAIIVALGIFGALFLNIALSLLQVTQSSDTYTQVAKMQFSLSLWQGILLYGIVAAVAEEWVFRGIIFNRLRKDYSPMMAACFSGVLFGAYHGNSVQGFYGVLMGILFALVYEKFNSFIVPVVMHCVANCAVYIVASNSSISEVVFTPVGCAVCLAVMAIGWWKMKKVETAAE